MFFNLFNSFFPQNFQNAEFLQQYYSRFVFDFCATLFLRCIYIAFPDSLKSIVPWAFSSQTVTPNSFSESVLFYVQDQLRTALYGYSVIVIHLLCVSHIGNIYFDNLYQEYPLPQALTAAKFCNIEFSFSFGF